jgi:ferredoxin-thioredoxin reductase catalytic subunit
MKIESAISDAAVDALLEKLQDEAEASGYHLNPDREFTRELLKSLLVNEKRYGYPACPCRLASGAKADDLDIICPCDYRDADLNEFGACFCALYVSEDVLAGRSQAASIPERRPPASQRRSGQPEGEGAVAVGKLSLPVWRCKVCGYLCAREGPPGTCPICKAKKDRFERFL